MRDTEAQRARSEANRDWAASETIDKKFASRSEVLAVWSIADSAFNRAEEVAASVAALTERMGATQGELAAHIADLRLHERQPAPPPPDAGEAFVDAVDALIEAWSVRPHREWWSRYGDLIDAICDARAAALPERSAPAPVTITWSRLSELLIVYVKAIPQGDTAHLTGLRAVVEALGYRMDGERP